MKLVKGLLWLVLFVGVVAVGGAIFLVNKVNPNDFKPQIAQQVENQTGRQLDLKGDLAWRFYPWVGITMNDFTLSNREGFSPENMLEAEQVDVQVKLLPLISRRLEIGKIKFESPIINLAQKADGETNWGDLVKVDQLSEADAVNDSGQAAGAALGGLVIQGIDISNGSIDWDDELGGQHVKLTEFSLNTGSVEPDQPIAFDLSTGVQASALPDSAEISLTGALLVSETFESIKLNELHGEIEMADLAADADIEAIQFVVPSGELDVNAIKAKLSQTGFDADVEVNSLSLGVNSGELGVDAIVGSVAMDQVRAKLKAEPLAYNLNTGIVKLKSINYEGDYQALPFNGITNDITFNVNANQLAIASQELNSEFNGVPISLDSENLQLDLNKETLILANYAAALGDVKISGDISIDQLLSDLSARGHLKSNQFDPRIILEKFGIGALNDLPAQAARTVVLETDFIGGLNAIGVKNLNLNIDETTLKGDFSMKNFTQLIYRFDLAADKLNVDNYLSEDKQATAEEAGPGAAAVLPLAALKGLDVKGKFEIAELNFVDLISNDVLVNIDTTQDRIEIAPLAARAFGGKTSNKIVYDVSGDVPSVDIESSLTTLDLGPFLQAMKMTDRLEGVGNVHSTLSASGVDVDSMIENLNGDIDIDLNDGAIRGADLQKSMLKVASLYKQLKGKDHGLSTDVGDKTKFSNFSSKINIENGILSTDSVDLKAPGLRVTGGGKVDLSKSELDLKLLVSVVETLEGQGGQTVDELKGETIPLKITGTLDSPRLLPDLSAIARRQLERKLSEKYLGGKKVSGEEFSKKAKDKLNRKLAEKLGIDLPEETEVDEDQSVQGEQIENVEIDQDVISEENFETETELEPEDPEEVLKQRLEEEKEKLKGKLLDSLFGN